MPEIKDAKSWGNGYFRFSIMDIIKIVTFVGSVMLFGTELSKKIEVLSAEFKSATTLHNTVHQSLEARLQRLEKAQDEQSKGWQFDTRKGEKK